MADGGWQKLRRFFFCLLPSAICLLLSCASSTPNQHLPAPEWDAIPLGVVEALCLRLQAEGLAAEGSRMTIVNSTQPLATERSILALRGSSRKGATAERMQAAVRYAARTIPVTVGGRCRWTAIDASTMDRRRDELIVELSAPLPNPYAPGHAGMFVRVALAGEHASWYWISLLPHPSGSWVVGFVQAVHD